MERHELTVTAEAAGCRLDKGLALLAPELSRSQIQTLAEKGSILKNGAAAGKKDTLREGDSIIITLPDPVPTGTQAENIPLEIIYEDDDLLVVNKPKGMVVHPAAGNYTGTLVPCCTTAETAFPVSMGKFAPVLCIASIRIPAGC